MLRAFFLAHARSPGAGVDNYEMQNYIADIQNSEGRFAVVTKRWVQDAMDAAASGAFALDETPAAYGEVVWSWHRDPGVYPSGLCGYGNGDKKGRSPGGARRKPSNHCAGKAGMSRLYL